jgi:hypothetical protein
LIALSLVALPLVKALFVFSVHIASHKAPCDDQGDKVCIPDRIQQIDIDTSSGLLLRTILKTFLHHSLHSPLTHPKD